MSKKKVVSFFQEKINRGDTENWETVMTKRSPVLLGKIGVALSVAAAAPGDTHPSDATDY